MLLNSGKANTQLIQRVESANALLGFNSSGLRVKRHFFQIQDLPIQNHQCYYTSDARELPELSVYIVTQGSTF